MAYKTRKKKVKKNVPEGVAHIHSTFNNTITTITDKDGQVVAWSSSGAIGYKGSKKSTPFAAGMAAEAAGKTAYDLGMRKIEVNVKGLGPRTAVPMFATGSTSSIVDAIEKEDVAYLKKFPKIGDKVARQIILDLKGKLVSNSNSASVDNTELIEALKALGYKTNDINKILPKIDNSRSLETQIKEALKLLLK